MSYKNACAKHITNLGLNEAEINLLNKEVAKKSEALAKIKEIESKPEYVKGDKKLIAEHRKILNNVKDTIKSDYQRMAKDFATDKLSTLKSRAFKDAVVENAKSGKLLLKEILVNKYKASKYNLYSKRYIEKNNFASYMQTLGE